MRPAGKPRPKLLGRPNPRLTTRGIQTSSEASKRAEKANAYVVPKLIRNPRAEAAKLMRSQ